MASKKTNSNLSAAAQARLKSFEAKQELQNKKETRRKSDNRLAIIVSAVVVVLALGSQIAYFSFGPGRVSAAPSATATPTPTPTSLIAPAACLKQPTPATGAKNGVPTSVPSLNIAEKRAWKGSMYVNGCELSISLDGTHAPQAASNFIALAKSGFYNNVTCHRLTTKGIYVLQCGDPKGDGTGGPGYAFGPNDENVPTQKVASNPSAVVYATGMLAMANSGATASQGSQFFIVYEDSPLSPAYSVFGKVTAGIDKIQSLAAQGTTGTTGDGAPNLAAKLGPIVLK